MIDVSRTRRWRSRRALPIRLTRRAGRSVPCGGAARLVAPSLIVTSSCELCVFERTHVRAQCGCQPSPAAVCYRSGREVYLRCTLVSTLTNTVQTSVYTYTTVAVFKVYYGVPYSAFDVAPPHNGRQTTGSATVIRSYTFNRVS